MPKRQLAIFDFDETIVSAGTLPQIIKFLPTYKLPPAYDREKLGWVDYANGVFKELQTMGYSPETLVKFVCMIPPIPGMLEFIQALCSSTEPKNDIILVSDCNRYFVTNWLNKHNILNCFSGIYCNPAEINDCGELVVRPYHCSDCPYSPVNLCKRRLLEEYLQMQRDLHINYDRVIYCGDGRNDFCPSLSMRPCDILCARKDAWLEKIIDQNRKKIKMIPEVFYWTNGYELIAKLIQKKT